MTRREQFIAERSARWQALHSLISNTRELKRSPLAISRMAQLYRAVCSDLMYARSLGLGRDITEHLDDLAGRAHNLLYSSKGYDWGAALRLLSSGFPQAFRKNWRFHLLASALFYVPLFVGYFGALADPSFVDGILPPSTLQSMEAAYSEGFQSGRATGADAAMAGFYIQNNIGIAFRCFATGILFGFGSMFFLVYNGLVIGSVLGYVTEVGYGLNILTFICGHGPFELSAIVIGGGAGIQMGYSLVKTSGLTRLDSLRRVAPDLFAQICGAGLMLLLAALIEGFWSPSAAPNQVKWAFSALMILLMIGYLAFAGRGVGRGRVPAP